MTQAQAWPEHSGSSTIVSLSNMSATPPAPNDKLHELVLHSLDEDQAQDVVSIRASLTYKRIFPFWNMIGQPQNQVLTATTFLRNQPFSAQATRVGVRICPV